MAKSDSNTPSWTVKFKTYLEHHLNAFKTSFRNLSATPLSSGFTAIAIGICLALPIAFYLFIINIQQISQQWQNSATLSIYVDAQSSPLQIKNVENKIKDYPFVEKINLITPEEALKEFKKASDLNDVLDLLPQNPLPYVFHVQINNNHVDAVILKQMKDTIIHERGVIKATFDFEWIEKINALISLAHVLISSLFVIVGLGVVFVVSNTIRLSLEHHRDEIEVLYQIGATSPFILRPYLYRGMLYTLLGAIIALVLITAVQTLVEPRIILLASLYKSIFHLEKLGFYDTLCLLAGCSVLGWLGAMIAFYQQHNMLKREAA